jgi:hypothetical protein
VVGGVALAGVLRYKPHLIDKGLVRAINMEAVRAAAKQKGTIAQLNRHIHRTGYAFAAFLLLIGVITYVATIMFITAPTGTSEFNAQYAQLRVAGILFTTVPLLIGGIGLLLYLVSGFEKLAGLKTDELLKKKS